MAAHREEPFLPTASRVVFATTQWSVVQAAGNGGADHAEQALEKLCRAYWKPLYAYVRRKGHSVHDAQDLTQEFFTCLLRLKSIEKVRREGKFRSYLLKALEHFLAHEWNRAHRIKRGRDYTFVSAEDLQAEERQRFEPVDAASPEKAFERRWAMTVLQQALDRLRGECQAAHKSELFEALKNTLSSDGPVARLAEIGVQLNLSEGAVKVAAHRLRQRYSEILREEIAQTVSSPEELKEEVRSLLTAMG